MGYPDQFTLVTESMPRKPVHIYPRNYQDGAAIIHAYEKGGYAIEHVVGEFGNPLKPGYLVITPPERTHTYSPELAEIHTRLCDAFGWANPSIRAGVAVGKAWSQFHSDFFRWYHGEVGNVYGAWTPIAWVDQLARRLRESIPGLKFKRLCQAVERIAVVLEQRQPARFACEPCSWCAPR